MKALNMVYLNILLVALGFAPLLIVLYRYRRILVMRKKGVRVMATVIDAGSSGLDEINTVWIEYSLAETGERLRCPLRVASTPYSIGQQLPVYYLPDRPEKPVPDPGRSYWLLIIFTLAIAIFYVYACLQVNRAAERGSF